MLAVILSISLSAQDRQVVGCVVDASGMPLKDATVTLKGSDVSLVVGEDGRFTVNASPYVKYVIVSKEGYITQEQEIDGTILVFRMIWDKKAQQEKEARLKAEEKARKEAAERAAKAEAERLEQERRAAELKAKAEAEEKARIAAETAAREKAEAARLKAEEKVRQEAEVAKRKAEEKAKKEAEKAKKEAEKAAEKARIEAEKARLKAEAEAAAEAKRAEEARLKAEAEAKAKAEAEMRAKVEAEAKARAEAEARIAAEAAARAEAEAKARLAAEMKAKAEAKAKVETERRTAAAGEQSSVNVQIPIQQTPVATELQKGTYIPADQPLTIEQQKARLEEMEKELKAAEREAKKQKREERRKTLKTRGVINSFEFSYNHQMASGKVIYTNTGYQSYGNLNPVAVDYMLGYRFGAYYSMSVGAGLSYNHTDLYISGDRIMSSYPSSDSSISIRYFDVPVYLNMKFYMTKGKVQPVLSLSGGMYCLSKTLMAEGGFGCLFRMGRITNFYIMASVKTTPWPEFSVQDDGYTIVQSVRYKPVFSPGVKMGFMF